MARSRGLEPPTPRLGILCSIHLSYERSKAYLYYNHQELHEKKPTNSFRTPKMPVINYV